MAAVTCSSSETCAICLEDFQEGQAQSKLNCGHTFHKECMKPWLVSHQTCPIGREKITSINGKPVSGPSGPLMGAAWALAALLQASPNAPGSSLEMEVRVVYDRSPESFSPRLHGTSMADHLRSRV